MEHSRARFAAVATQSSSVSEAEHNFGPVPSVSTTKSLASAPKKIGATLSPTLD